MTQYAYGEKKQDVQLCFKRHILEKSERFAAEPMADLYRINLLGMMLNRLEELKRTGLSESSAVQRTLYEFADIAQRMREAGFEEGKAYEAHASRWPQMTEAEAADYIREHDDFLHKRSVGIALCVASLVPLMIGAAVSEVFLADLFVLFGLIGMFGFIGLGVYAIVAAKKPRDEKRVKSGLYSLTASVRGRLEKLKDAIEEKARRRKGKGVATIVMSVIPLFIGAALSEVFYSDLWPILGVAGMFVMIAMGVYQLCMGDGEKKAIRRVLNAKD